MSFTVAAAGPVFVTLTSAAGIVVTTDDVLFPEAGSDVVVTMAAVFVSVPDTVDTTFTVSTRLAAGASVPTVHVTTPLACTPPFVALANVTVPGSVSVTTTFHALDGPALLNVITYTSVSPGAAPAGPVLLTLTFADALTTVATDDVSLPATGSLVAAVPTARFVSVPVAPALTRTYIRSVSDVPDARFPTVHVESPPLHDPTVTFTESIVSPAGTVSRTATPVAVLGPAFDTTTR